MEMKKVGNQTILYIFKARCSILKVPELFLLARVCCAVCNRISP
jgi:hypothetical protein